MFSGFSDHFWPAPHLAQTASWPHFDQTVSCLNLCEPSLTPKNLGQWGCFSGQIVAHVLFFGPWTGPHCGVWCVCAVVVVLVVLCCGVVCRCGVQIFVGASRFGRSPSAGPPSARPPQISRFFFNLSRHHFRSFSLSLGLFSWNIGGVSEAPGP